MNERVLVVVVIVLVALVAVQTIQIFSSNQPVSTTGMASGNMMSQGEQFNSVEEMMAAHHGSSSGGMIGGCG